MSLAEVLKARRRQGRCGFVPFITAGDPSLAATARLAKALARDGADILELGVPFSDPMADGPVIQAADERALKAGATLKGVLALVARLRRGGFSTPVVLFSYLNPILAMGVERFAVACRKSGVAGVLAVDLPLEEGDGLRRALLAVGVEPVLLASPTTTAKRLAAIGRAGGSLVYYVSREGVTGARAGLPAGLSRRLRFVRRKTGKPLIVGFGVSTQRQARALAAECAGVVVGSALVSAAHAGGARALSRLARSLVGGLRCSS